MGGFLAHVVKQNKGSLNHDNILQMPNLISKRNMPSSRDAFMDESHKKRNMRLYVVNSHYVQHLTVILPQSMQLTQKCHLSRLIRLNNMNLKGE